MANKELTLYVAENVCGECEQVVSAYKSNKIETKGVPANTKINMIDLTSEENAEYVLDRDLPGIPAAMYGDKACPIYINEETLKVTIDCKS